MKQDGEKNDAIGMGGWCCDRFHHRQRITVSGAAEIRLAEQFSMGYLQFNVMKRDKLIEKYATQRGLKDFKVSWQRFNGPVAMNEALLSAPPTSSAAGCRA